MNTRETWGFLKVHSCRGIMLLQQQSQANAPLCPFQFSFTFAFLQSIQNPVHAKKISFISLWSLNSLHLFPLRRAAGASIYEAEQMVGMQRGETGMEPNEILKPNCCLGPLGTESSWFLGVFLNTSVCFSVLTLHVDSNLWPACCGQTEPGCSGRGGLNLVAIILCGAGAFLEMTQNTSQTTVLMWQDWERRACLWKQQMNASLIRMKRFFFTVLLDHRGHDSED